MRTPLAVGCVVAAVLTAHAAAPPVADPLDLNGDPLPPGAVARLGSARLRHGDTVRALCYSPDGRLLVTAGEDRLVRVRAAATGRLMFELSGHRLIASAVAVSPDSRTIASGDYGNEIRLWDAGTGTLTRVIKTGFLAPTSFAFSPDGKVLAVGGLRGGVYLWDVATGTRLDQLPGQTTDVYWLAFRPDGKGILTGGVDGKLMRWTLADGKPSTHDVLAAAAPFALSPRGDRAVVAKPGGPAEFAALDRLPPTARFVSRKRALTTVAWSPANDFVAVAHRDGAVVLHDAASGRELRRCGEAARERTVRALAFAPDGKTLATAEGTAVRLWSTLTGEQLPLAAGHAGPVTGVGFDPTGGRVATSSMDGRAALWDRATGRHRSWMAGHERGATCVAYSPDGRFIATGAGDDLVRLYDGTNGKILRTAKKEAPHTYFVAFTPDSKTLISLGADKHLSRWLTDGSAPPAADAVGRLVRRMALRPDGKMIALVHSIVTLHDFPTGLQRRMFTADFSQAVVGFSSDGKKVALSRRGAVLLWETESGRKLQEVHADSREVHAVAFSPRTGMLATAGEDGVVRLWDPETGQERRAFRGHLGPVRALAYSADGKWLVSGSGDGTALVWEPASDPAGPAGGLSLAWAGLAAEDGRTGYAAICTLAAQPGPAVKLLSERLTPARADDAHARLVADLSDDKARPAALAELERLGHRAEVALRRAPADGPAAAVIRGLLDRLDAPVQDTDRLRQIRALEALERIGSPEAKALLRSLAGGAASAELTREAAASLARLEGKR